MDKYTTQNFNIIRSRKAVISLKDARVSLKESSVSRPTDGSFFVVNKNYQNE